MHTKKTKQTTDLLGLRKEVLKHYIAGDSQEEITKALKGKLPDKKLKTLIQESEFLSPKNFRLGALLIFIITLATPPASVYLRGYEYRELLDIISIVSVSLALPFLLFSLVLYKLKDLQIFIRITALFLFYYVFALILLLLISADIKIWTLSLFHIVLLPTFIGEFLKLLKLKENLSSK